MDYLKQLQERYAQYTTQAQQVRKKASPLAGIFGIGGGPKDDPCHMAFYQDIQALTDAYLASGPSPESAAQVVDFLLRASKEHSSKDTYWFMTAAQGHAKKLIPLMTPEACHPLLDWYLTAFPNRLRTPLQEELVSLLDCHSKLSCQNTEPSI